MENQDNTPKSTPKTLGEELTPDTFTIVIQGKTYKIEPLGLGGQAKLASLIGKVLKSMTRETTTEKIDGKESAAGKKKVQVKTSTKNSISVGDFLTDAPEMIPQVIAIGLEEDFEVVDSWRSKADREKALDAFDKIIHVNDSVDELLGKSITLLGSM